jgi:hypothetical protein
LATAIRTLAEQWDEVLARLEPGPREELLGLVRQLADEQGDQERRAIAVVELLTTVLPPEHAVLRALFADDDVRFGGRPGALRSAVAPLARRAAGGLLAEQPPSAPDPLRAQAEAWLLAAPALSPEEVRANGQDPDHPSLIRLDRIDGGTQLPAFQFDGQGRPVPVVLEINALLDADDDPWGVADWWLGANAWLDAVPADLLGRVDDTVLLASALAVSEVD